MEEEIELRGGTKSYSEKFPGPSSSQRDDSLHLFQLQICYGVVKAAWSPMSPFVGRTVLNRCAMPIIIECWMYLK
jgi:hypothetical protein